MTIDDIMEKIQVVDWNDKELYAHVVTKVEEVGLSRMQTQTKLDQGDFFAGAMAAMTALGLSPARYPASWTLGIMFGRSPLDKRMLRDSND